MTTDHLKAIEAWVAASTSHNYEAKTGKRLGDILDELSASRELTEHVEGLIAERMATGEKSRKDTILDLFKTYSEIWAARHRAFSRAMDLHGGELPHDLNERATVMDDKIKAGIYRQVMRRLKEIFRAEFSPPSGGSS